MILSTGYLASQSKGEIHVLSLRGLMSWITVVVVLVAWVLVGLGVAYLFGRFVHGVEISGHARDLAPPVLSHLRLVKRARTSSRATAHTKIRREAAGARRSH
jgi:uncharacterized membrane protein